MKIEIDRTELVNALALASKAVVDLREFEAPVVKELSEMFKYADVAEMARTSSLCISANCRKKALLA